MLKSVSDDFPLYSGDDDNNPLHYVLKSSVRAEDRGRHWGRDSEHWTGPETSSETICSVGLVSRGKYLTDWLTCSGRRREVWTWAWAEDTQQPQRPGTWWVSTRLTTPWDRADAKLRVMWGGRTQKISEDVFGTMRPLTVIYLSLLCQ